MDDVRQAVARLVAAARLEGGLEMLARLGDEDERIDALLDQAEDGAITARGLREVAEADLLQTVVDLAGSPGRARGSRPR